MPIHAFRTALVTGASSGLGQHFAGVLAEAGASVTLAARRRDRVEEAAEVQRKLGHVAQAATLDVTDPDSVTALFANTEPFDIVVNNAGIAGTSAALETSPAAFDKVLDTNLTGALWTAKGSLP